MLLQETCSGHGTCDCGRCKCNDKYTGAYCEECPVSFLFIYLERLEFLKLELASSNA